VGNIIRDTAARLRGPLKSLALKCFGDNRAVIDALKRVDSGLRKKAATSEMRPVTKAEDMGVNVVGYLTGEFGLGEAARADIRCLESEGIPYAPINYEVAHHSNRDTTVKGLTDKNPYRVNLVHMNMDIVMDLVRERGPAFFEGKYNIAFWVWEFPSFPERFLECFGVFDEIWTPSNFSQNAISQVSGVPVVRMPHAIDIDPKVGPDRERFGFGKDEFVFLIMFDFYSSYLRKNPVAAVRAFKAAFGDDTRARLVIKHINSGKHKGDLADFNRELAGMNVQIIDRHLRMDEIYSLMASSDCYVSLHRSEGFGLTIAEAMALGKPVIATDYSGNTDFMDVTNSFPVRFEITEMQKDFPPYEKGVTWAEPDVAHAAELMRLVFEDKVLRGRIAEKAARDMDRYYTASAVGRLFRARIENISRFV